MLNKEKSEGSTDRVFDDAASQIADFSFDQKVASVFDDMVSRSVPFYDEIQRMSCELAADFAEPGSNLYDIGCSTATTLLALDEKLDPSVRFFGIDNSEEMLLKAKGKIAQSGTRRAIELQAVDVHKGMVVENASVVTMLLTLQFVRPLYRDQVMKTLYNGLNENGCLIIVEKLTCEHTDFNRLFIEHYYEYKRRKGYSEIEISKKREALENVLIPYRSEENIHLLKETGFRYVEEYFRWYNFCGIIAVK
ncbi:carboxy-S-adenosyl-L-methionine synthase CmoA [Pontiella sulfatireligans]|uniref:Carboxy-S-adenosyl-L-methionine synthase n=1 Tax=Pontiella sulfatireligans TaxID=2750658 RepID=A0A6C2UPQ2_9BACT|nr:carboxy-S-adenosyl-L-methionine synthase CmoA [Pontiella sulfatireligans]VGO20986.1 Carboxy-S-adenosyl-L-methionine synthase [Pontiella sulfatireligans]